MDKIKYKNRLWKDKRGLSLTTLTEAVIGIMLIMVILGAVIFAGLNQQYNKNYDGSFGVGGQVNVTQTSFNQYQQTLQNGLGSDASTSQINAVNLVGSWGMIYSGIIQVLNFVSGGFIQNIIGLLHMGQAGTYLGLALRLLFIFGIGFIIIKILFKVKP